MSHFYYSNSDLVCYIWTCALESPLFSSIYLCLTLWNSGPYLLWVQHQSWSQSLFELVTSCSVQLQSLISDLCPLNPMTTFDCCAQLSGVQASITSLHSTNDHLITPMLLNAYSIINAYPAHIMDVTRFSIATPFVILFFIYYLCPMLSLFTICTDHPLV